MAITKNFRTEFGGFCSATWKATDKRQFLYSNAERIKRGAEITVEYKGQTHIFVAHKGDVKILGRVKHPYRGSCLIGRVHGIVKWAKTFMKSYPDVWLFVSKVKIA